MVVIKKRQALSKYHKNKGFKWWTCTRIMQIPMQKTYCNVLLQFFCRVISPSPISQLIYLSTFHQSSNEDLTYQEIKDLQDHKRNVWIHRGSTTHNKDDRMVLTCYIQQLQINKLYNYKWGRPTVRPTDRHGPLLQDLQKWKAKSTDQNFYTLILDESKWLQK